LRLIEEEKALQRKLHPEEEGDKEDSRIKDGDDEKKEGDQTA
jgi:hypothetical protein